MIRLYTVFRRLLKNVVMPRTAYRFFIKDWMSLTDLKNFADAVSSMRFTRNLESVKMVDPRAARILVIAPHPDDDLIGAGGTLITAIKGGAKVLSIYLSRGRKEEAELLTEEVQSLSYRMGYETRFLDHYSNQIPIDQDTVSLINRSLKEFKPEALFLPFFCDDHDDHRRASHLLWEVFKQQGIDKSLTIWAYQVYTALIPNVAVDITDIAEEKANAIRSLKSQSRTRDWAHFTMGLNAFNSRFLPGSPKSQYVETFFVLPLNDYMALCARYFEKASAQIYYTEAYLN